MLRVTEGPARGTRFGFAAIAVLGLPLGCASAEPSRLRSTAPAAAKPAPADLTGEWRRGPFLLFVDEGKYRISRAGNPEPDAFGELHVEQGAWRFKDTGGSLACQGSALYSVSRESGALTFTALGDVCEGRRSVLHGDWTASATRTELSDAEREAVSAVLRAETAGFEACNASEGASPGGTGDLVVRFINTFRFSDS